MVKEIKTFNQENFLKEKDNFCVAVACYPEGHPECPILKKNLEYLKIKVEAGADFVITQLFFDLEKLLRFREKAEKFGINVPIVPGIFPLKRYSEIKFLSKNLGIILPKNFRKKLRSIKKSQKFLRKFAKNILFQWLKNYLERKFLVFIFLQ